MKVSWFQLMPYRFLPEDFEEKYRSVWVDVPRHLYDPEIGAQIYNDTLDELEFAARVGYDGVCVNEHHQNAYGLMPSPNLMAAALARRTKRAKIAILGNAICLRDHPLRVAEEVAMLDVITKGRIISGVCSRGGGRVHGLQHGPHDVAGPVPGILRPDHPGVDRAGTVFLRRRTLQLPVCESLAASLSEVPPSCVDALAGKPGYD